jgi:iron complex outermembrane receptor protein
MKLSRIGAALLIGCSVAAMSSQALAQAVVASDQIEEVLVTAQLRAESAQSVPVSLTTIPVQDFKDSNFKGLRDLQYLSPSIYVTAANGNTPEIRGVSTNTFNNGSEQAVGVLVDGVVIGFVDDLGVDNLTDLDHIEVLRGPQGTLFGKNASAGVISIFTKNPVIGSSEGDVHLQYGEHNDVNANADYNIPIDSTKAARFTLYEQNRDGIVRNAFLDKRAGDMQGQGGRGKFLWQPNGNLSILLSGDYRHLRQAGNFLATWRNCGRGFLTFAPSCIGLLGIGVVPGPDNLESGDVKVGHRITQSYGTMANVNYNWGDYTLTSISAYRGLKRHVDQTLVAGPIPFVTADQIYDGNQLSQEFRITSPVGGFFDYVAGLYFYDRNTHVIAYQHGPYAGRAVALHGPGAELSTPGGRQHISNVTESEAAYLNTTLHFTPELQLVAGGRFTYDTNSTSTHTDVIPNVFPMPGGVTRITDAKSIDNSNFSYRIAPQYFVTPEIMMYGSYATGYKGAVEDAESTSGIRTIAAETVKAFEVGTKTTLLDRRLVVNVAAFDQKFKNFQTSVFDPIVNGFVLGSAGGMKSRGVELDVTAKPAQEFTLTGGLAYLDAVYSDFKASCYSNFAPIAEKPTTNPAGVGGCYTIPGTTAAFTQAAGFPLNNASKWAFTLGADYVHEMGDQFILDIGARYVYRSTFFTTGYDPNTRIPSYGIANLDIGFGSSDGRWRISVFARNLFDTYYVSAIQSTALDAGAYVNIISPEAKRTFGLALDLHF